MSRITRLGWLAYALALVVIVADQALKFWVLNVFDLPGRLDALRAAGAPAFIPVLGPFHLSLVTNEGVSFGFLNIGATWTRWVLSAFSVAVAGALAVWVRKADKPLLAVAVGFIIGGAIGNVIDRLRLGSVTDFIDFSSLHFFPWVFNVADSAITVGSVLLIWDLFLAPKNPVPAESAGKQGA
jgi:signal peptidase II